MLFIRMKFNDRIYDITMFFLILIQMSLLFLETTWFIGIGLGFNIGLWLGYSLSRLIK